MVPTSTLLGNSTSITIHANLLLYYSPLSDNVARW